MMGNDDARFLEGLRYGQALLNEGRSRLHKSVPGALVAEVLRHICRRRSNIDQVYRLNFDQGR